MTTPYIFKTRVSGIPCQCSVSFAPPTCTDLDAFEFELLDRGGYKAAWLERKLEPNDVQDLFFEYEAQIAS